MSTEQQPPEQPEDNSNVDETTQARAKSEDQPQAQLSVEQQLQAQLEAARAKAEDNWDKLLRSQAEMENIRKRTARDVENARKYALEGIATELLPVRDSLELGLDAISKDDASVESARDGLQLIQQMMAKLMEQYSIKPVNPVGEVFNPELHQAMSMQETTEQPANTVISVMQKGYTLNDRLLRPAMVVVAKAPAGEKSAE